jgi:hypothetical protein
MYSSMTSFTEHHAIIDLLKPGVLRIGRVTGLVWDNVVGMINTVHQANAAMGAFVPLSEKGAIFRNLFEIKRSCHVLSPEGESEPHSENSNDCHPIPNVHKKYRDSKKFAIIRSGYVRSPIVP